LKHSSNIFLIGPMGAGKTTVGRQLAKYLNIQFFDSDREIETRTGVDIRMIFEYEGEEGFRRREQIILSELTRLKRIVLATGGGAILSSQNCEYLREHGYVVYLQCSVDRQIERTSKDNHRPLLNTENPREKLQDLMKIRSPLYEACADYTVDTGRLSSRMAVKQILNTFQPCDSKDEY